MSIKLFISHSSIDKAFVRKLDTSLVSNGVNVFLDERDIKLGESIPDKIYSALAEATHVIYVISKNSIVSKWVSEELAIAKMQEKSAIGTKIFPVLIDDLEVPTSIKHIKYCDFINWRSYNHFANSMRVVFDALNVELKIPESTEAHFYFRNFILFNEVEVLIDTISITLESCTYIWHGISSFASKEDESNVSRFITKMMMYDIPINHLENLVDKIFKEQLNCDSNLGMIADKMNSLLPMIVYREKFPEKLSIASGKSKEAELITKEISGMLKDFRLKISEPIFSGYVA